MTSELREQAFRVHVDAPYEAALARVREALKAEGFGVITEVDIQATLKEKIGAEFRRYAILGACNPAFAHRALSTEPLIGLLLPCNVIVYEADDGQGSEISIVDPLAMLGVVDEPALQEVADDAHARLSRAADALRA